MHLKSSYVYLDIASFSACISTYIDILLKSSGSFTDNDATPHLVVADEAVLPHVGGEGGHPAAGRVEGPGVQAAEGHGGALPAAEVGCTVLYCTVLWCTVPGAEVRHLEAGHPRGVVRHDAVDGGAVHGVHALLLRVADQVVKPNNNETKLESRA